MINLHAQVRRAHAPDHRQISNLVNNESNTHRHLDWRPALEWLGDLNFWALENRGEIAAVLACPEDPNDVAWIRLFSYHAHLSGPEAWSALWDFARADIFNTNPRAVVASIVMKQWFQSLLLESGFKTRWNIVMLELRLDETFPVINIENVRIRPMRESDMDEVARIDREAFGVFWHNSEDSLQRARNQSVYATVAEDGNGLIGYQLSTGNPFGAHLARLGVRVEAQGRGVGSVLLWDLIHNSGVLGSGRLSVNTQEDNVASLNLYRKFGFVRTGESYPVLVHSPGGVF
jgi:ribosomal-protein-alanine N-acetyltransferase